MTMPTGSPGWQLILLGFAVLFILWETWRGWRAGLIRSGAHLAALMVSTILGYYTAQVAAAPFGGFSEFSGIMAGLLVGGGVCVVTFLVMWILGSVLFKKTSQQSSGIFRLLWGIGGAFFGFILGILIVWSGVSIVRGLGAFASGRVAPPSAASTNVESPYSGNAATEPSASSEVARSLVTLKDSLELGPLGKAIDATDPINADTYQLISEISAVIGNQEVMLRFLQYPGIQRIVQNPRITELINNPSVLESSQSGNFLALMSNPALLAAVQDPAFAEELKKVDLRAALKFALEKPTPSPAPSPAATKK